MSLHGAGVYETPDYEQTEREILADIRAELQKISTVLDAFVSMPFGAPDWYCRCTSPPNNGEDGPERRNPGNLLACPDCGMVRP